MKIYFGRLPEGIVVNLDKTFSLHLKNCDYCFECAIEKLFNIYEKYEYKNEIVLYSINPMIFQFLPRKFMDCIYFIDENNNHIQFTKDEICMWRYSIMDIGEALVDDSRILNWKN